MTCRNLYDEKIERKTGIGHDTTRKIATRAIDRAGCEDIHEVLAYVGDLDRSGRIPRVTDGTKLSRDIRNAILNNPKLKSHEAVIDMENITIPRILEETRPARSIIENVQHQHSYEVDGQEIRDIVRINEAVKPRLTEANKAKRKQFCEWGVREN